MLGSCFGGLHAVGYLSYHWRVFTVESVTNRDKGIATNMFFGLPDVCLFALAREGRPGVRQEELKEKKEEVARMTEVAEDLGKQLAEATLRVEELNCKLQADLLHGSNIANQVRPPPFPRFHKSRGLWRSKLAEYCSPCKWRRFLPRASPGNGPSEGALCRTWTESPLVQGSPRGTG